MGAIAPGMVTDSLGSFECLAAVVKEPTLDERALAASLNSYCHAVPNEYITIAYFPAGLMVKWFVDGFCGEEARAAREGGIGLFEYLDQAAPEGPTGLCVLPHLIGSSNPHFDPQATGVVIGLTQRTRRIDLYKGILEGLACELSIVADLLGSAIGRFDTIRCTGGGARSRLGLQLRATITGRRMQTLTCPEAVCLGAALLAGVSAGTYTDLTEAVQQVVSVADTVAPDPASAAAYSEQVERYRLLYPALAPLRKKPSTSEGRHGREE
jgi:xylulokinase